MLSTMLIYNAILSHRTRPQKTVHRLDRTTFQAAIQQHPTIAQAWEVPKQHRVIKTHLAPKTERHPIHHQLVDFQQIPGLLQRIEVVQPVPHRKTFHHKCWQTLLNKQKQILPLQLQQKTILRNNYIEVILYIVPLWLYKLYLWNCVYVLM